MNHCPVRHQTIAAFALLAAAFLTMLVLPASAFERKSFDRSRFARPDFTDPAVAAKPATAPNAATARPAEPDSGLVELFGDSLLTAKGKPADLASLNGKTIALYFSASWCPPCRAFSPILVDVADDLRKSGKPFELVLVGCDQSEEKALAYMAAHKMGGFLVPPEADANRALCNRYGVRGIPALVVVDSSARTIDSSARSTVQSAHDDPDAVWAKWSR
jgi:nucleoredoxin